MNSYRIHEQEPMTERQCAEIATLYELLGWGSGYSVQTVKKAFDRSSYRAVVTAADERVVGFLRGFSDGVICSWIAEVAVHPEHQRRGVGRALTTRFVEAFKNTAVYAEAVTNSGSETLLSKCGLRAQPRLAAFASAGRSD